MVERTGFFPPGQLPLLNKHPQVGLVCVQASGHCKWLAPCDFWVHICVGFDVSRGQRYFLDVLLLRVSAGRQAGWGNQVMTSNRHLFAEPNCSSQIHTDVTTFEKCHLPRQVPSKRQK